MGRYNSTRVDEGKKCRLLLAIKMKARAGVGKGEEDPLCDPGSELPLGRSARVVARIANGMKKKKCCKGTSLPHTAPVSFSGIVSFVFVHSSLGKKYFDRSLIFGAVVVHPERR